MKRRQKKLLRLIQVCYNKRTNDETIRRNHIDHEGGGAVIIRQPEIRVPVGELDREKLKSVERYARVCYKSEGMMDGGEFHPNFLKSMVARGHESVIEHEKVTVMFIVDRGITHEIVRHRVGSYSQESTRYCNYNADKFGNEITVIEPYFFEAGSPAYAVWKETCEKTEAAYFALLEAGASPQEARSVLPNSLKTEIVTTYNFREWRHFFRLRAAAPAHPQMRQAAIPLLKVFQQAFPELFMDIAFDESFPAEKEARVVLTDALFHPLPDSEGAK